MSVTVYPKSMALTQSITVMLWAWWQIIAFAFAGAFENFLDKVLGRKTPQPHFNFSPPTYSGACDCALVLDVSDSMLEEDYPPSRLGAAQQAAKTYARQLAEQQPQWSLMVIAFGTTAITVCPPTRLTDLQLIEYCIDGMSSMGSTDMKAGLDLALPYQKLRQLVLLSDGDHNGTDDPVPTAEQIKRYAIVECVGIGGSPKNVNEVLLKEIASYGKDGSKLYRWIGDSVQLNQHFEDLAGRISRT